MNPFDSRAPLAARWFTWPLGLAGGSGLAACGLYGIWIIDAPPAWRGPVWLVAIAIAALAIPLIEVRARRLMRTLGEITAGKLEPSIPNLQRAVAEAHAAPRKLLASNMAGWTVLATGVAIALKWVSPWMDWEAAARIAALGYTLGPLATLLAHVPMLHRARRLVRQTAARGLDAEHLAGAVASAGVGLQGRLIVFGISIAAIPALVVADASTVLAARHAEALVGIAGGPRLAALDSELDRLRLEVFGLAAGLVAVAALASAALGRSVAAPLRELAKHAERPAFGSGAIPETLVAEDEIWTLATAFLRQEVHLAAMVDQLRAAGSQISSTTEQILATSSKHEAGSARQLAVVVQTASTTEQLAKFAKSIAGNAGEVAETARRTLNSAQQARANAVAFAEAMARMRRGNEAVTESALELNGCVGQIGRIVEFINGVADKSDLLALNAELEGVKAGEVGQGFSLVATEMRRMAENVTRSTQEIGELIERIRDATSGVVNATKAGMRTTEASVVQVDALSKSLAAIVELAGHTDEAVRTISSATQQQTTGTDQLASAMGEILSVTKETEVATQAIIAANVELVRLAKDIATAVDVFRPA